MSTSGDGQVVIGAVAAQWSAHRSELERQVAAEKAETWRLRERVRNLQDATRLLGLYAAGHTDAEGKAKPERQAAFERVMNHADAQKAVMEAWKAEQWAWQVKCKRALVTLAWLVRCNSPLRFMELTGPSAKKWVMGYAEAQATANEAMAALESEDEGDGEGEGGGTENSLSPGASLGGPDGPA